LLIPPNAINNVAALYPVPRRPKSYTKGAVFSKP
jgi:hypothetical protein